MKLYDGMQGKSWSNFDAQSFVNSYRDNVEGAKISRYANAATGTQFESGFFGIGAKSYSIVGINANGVPRIQQAIEAYVRNIQSAMATLDEKTKVDVAFKSDDVQAALQLFVAKVKEDCNNLISQLLAFYDKLTDVRNAYAAAMGTLSGNISSDTSAFATGSEYKVGQR